MAIKEIVEDACNKITEVLQEAFSKANDEYEFYAITTGIFGNLESIGADAIDRWNKKK